MSTRNYHSLTPTHHTTIPPPLAPSSTTLPTPFVAVITGAGKGLGKHITLAYAAAGASGLSISSRTASDLDALEAEIRAVAKRRDVEIVKSVCDVRCEEEVRGLEAEVRARWGRVDVVVANAGVISGYVERKAEEGGGEKGKEEGGAESNLPIGVVEDEDWKRVLEINVFGVWRVCKAFLPLLESTTDGPQSIICSSSLAAHSTNSSVCPIAYNVSKLSINRLMEHIANDHGAKGVQAYALHPGAVLTPQTINHKGEVWSGLLSDDEGLAGAFCVWLTKEKRPWLSGRYVSCNWDVGELEAMKEEILSGDLLKFRMAV